VGQDFRRVGGPRRARPTSLTSPPLGSRSGGGVYLERADRWRDGTLIPTTGHQDVFVRLGLRLFQDTAWPTELAVVLPVVLSSEGPATIHSPGTFSLSVARDFAL
jgi:hypothetical protein